VQAAPAVLAVPEVQAAQEVPAELAARAAPA
jgi:hypothetical protein